MAITRTLAAILLAQILAGTALAQEAASAEFGRASGGQLAFAVRKTSLPFSGSLGMAFPFLSGHEGKRNAATLGGTLVKDRLWFFATAEQTDTPRLSDAAPRFDTNLNALLGDRQSLGAALSAGETTAPSSFLSLRYTGIVSSNMFFSATFGRSSSQTAPAPFDWPR
jgi:hypothetical protein